MLAGRRSIKKGETLARGENIGKDRARQLGVGQGDPAVRGKAGLGT